MFEGLEGYRTYLIAIAEFLLGAGAFVDPNIAGFLAGYVGVESGTILILVALITAGLRRATKGPGKI